MRNRKSFLLASHVSLLTLLLLLCTPAVVHAQWEPDVRLTFNDSSSKLCPSDMGRAVTVDSMGGVHVVWIDFRDTPPDKGEIYYKRSTDWGNSWEADVRLTSDTALSWYPAVEAERQGRIHVAWLDRRYGFCWEVFYKRSTDGGATWEPDVSLSDSGQFNYLFLRGITSDEQGWVHVVCINRVLNPPGPIQLWHRRSRDGGSTWDPWMLVKDSVDSYDATLASGMGHDVHILTGYPYYLRSSDGGTTWRDTVLTVTPFALKPRLNVDRANRVHALWMDQREGPFIYEFYYKQSTDGGITWQPDFRLTHSDTIPDSEPVIASDSTGRIHLIYWVQGHGLFYKSSTDAGMTWEPSYQIVPEFSNIPHISVDSKRNAHLVYENQPDTSRRNGEIYYKRWLSSQGVEQYAVPSPDSRFPFSIRPNPFVSYTLVPGHASERFALYDISGRRVGVYRGDRVGADLTPGVYFIKPEEKQSKPLRIVKLR